MATYQIGSHKYSIDNSVQGEALVEALQELADMQETAALPVVAPANPGAVYDPSQKSSGLYDNLVGAGETALSLATGATTGAAGFIGGAASGLARELAGGDFGSMDAANRIKQSAEQGAANLTYAPRTEQGQSQVQAVGEALAPLTAVAPMSGEINAIASGVRQAAPALSRTPPALFDANGEISPAFAKALKKQGIDLVNVQSDLPRIRKGLSPERAAKDLLVSKLRSGDRDGFLVDKMLSPTLGVVEDSLAKEAVKQGFRPGDVQAIKTALPETKREMLRMLNIKRSIYGNERKSLEMRPSDVIGDSALRRVGFIRKTANAARDELNSIANRDLPGKAINTENIAANFMKEMEKIDVEVDMSSGRPVPNYSGSMIAKDRTSQRVINDVISLLSEDKKPDALRAHKLKRQLDAMIDFRKQSVSGLTEAGRRVAKSVRASLNDAIRETSDDYARVNDTLSTSLDALQSFEKSVGKSIDLWAPNADKAIGQDLRGLMSNNKSRVRLENALSNIEDTAIELGGQFPDDIRDLVLFDKTLDEKFGSSARRSFSGEIESSAGRAISKAENLAVGAATQGIIPTAVKAGSDLIVGAKNMLFREKEINDYKSFDSIERLLKRK